MITSLIRGLILLVGCGFIAATAIALSTLAFVSGMKGISQASVYIPVLGWLACVVIAAGGAWLLSNIAVGTEYEQDSGAAVRVGVLLSSLGMLLITIMATGWGGQRFLSVGAFVLVYTIALQVVVHKALRRGVRMRMGKYARGVGKTCAQCGYDVASLGEHVPCPECGGVMRVASPVSPTPPGAQ